MEYSIPTMEEKNLKYFNSPEKVLNNILQLLSNSLLSM